MIEIVLKSLLAGIFIGLGDLTFIAIDNKVVGAFIFSIGLLTIIKQKLFLYTGKVGYADSISDFIKVIIGYIFNIIGVYLMCLYAKNFYGLDKIFATEMNYANNINYIAFIVQSLFTGALMFIAVDSKSEIVTIMCVMAFILLGGKHSIAISFFLNVWKYPLLSLIFMVGNGLGGQIFRRISRIGIKNE